MDSMTGDLPLTCPHPQSERQTHPSPKEELNSVTIHDITAVPLQNKEYDGETVKTKTSQKAVVISVKQWQQLSHNK